MPYNSKNDLPKNVTNVLPSHAQDIYLEAYNNAYDEYSNQSDQEEAAHRVAWGAVKTKYEKGEDGNWHQKS